MEDPVRLQAVEWFVEGDQAKIGGVRRQKYGREDGTYLLVVIGRGQFRKMDHAFIVLATAFPFKMEWFGDVMATCFRFVMVVMMAEAMVAKPRCVNEAGAGMVLLRTIMDVDVHIQGEEEDMDGQQQGQCLEDSLFHAAKIGVFLSCCAFPKRKKEKHNAGIFDGTAGGFD